MEIHPISPILKWAGSKRWLVSKLENLYNKNLRLVDPFVGSASVPLYLCPEKCLISDVNPHLMNLHRWVKHGLEWDESLGISFEYDKNTYYENRDKFNALCHAREFWTKEGALLFYYLNRTGFNGLCRFNSQGFFNVPFGRHKVVHLKTSFLEYKQNMERWELYCGDFESLPIQENDFIYADPPYDVEFTQFAPTDFTWDDQIRLAKWLSKHTGPVIASNQHTKRIVDLYTDLGFKIYQEEAPRSISCTGDRTPALEILAMKGLQ